VKRQTNLVVKEVLFTEEDDRKLYKAHPKEFCYNCLYIDMCEHRFNLDECEIWREYQG
jgi:hypothetical protein